MKTSSCKAKGRRLTSLAKERLLKRFPELQDGDIVVTPSGVPGRDLHLSPKAEALIPLEVEGKNCETASVWAWMKQAKSNTRPGRMPCVVFTRNREGDVYAMLRLDDLLELL